MMQTRTIAALVFVLISGGLTTGCAMLNKAELQYTRTTTIGQELIDLQEAKTKGAVSEKEYSETKDKIIKNDPMMRDHFSKHKKAE